jgi:predicted nucleic acid-binding protein
MPQRKEPHHLQGSQRGEALQGSSAPASAVGQRARVKEGPARCARSVCRQEESARRTCTLHRRRLPGRHAGGARSGATRRPAPANILLYSISADPGERRKREIAIALLEDDQLALSAQVLQEFCVQATRPTRTDAIEHELAAGLIRTWLRFRVQNTTPQLMERALEIKAAHRLSYWDAAIVAAARTLGCQVLLSEDMAHGRELAGVRILDPFR